MKKIQFLVLASVASIFASGVASADYFYVQDKNDPSAGGVMIDLTINDSNLGGANLSPVKIEMFIKNLLENHQNDAQDQILLADLNNISDNSSYKYSTPNYTSYFLGDLSVTDYGDNIPSDFHPGSGGTPPGGNSPSVVITPEPSTYALLAVGLGLIFFMGRRKEATLEPIKVVENRHC